MSSRTATEGDTEGDKSVVYTEWVSVLTFQAAVEKKIARWSKRYMVLHIHEPGAAKASAGAAGSEAACSTLSFYENEHDPEPEIFFRFLSKDCFKLKKYKATEKYKGKVNVFKLRFFKKHINADAKARKDKKSQVIYI